MYTVTPKVYSRALTSDHPCLELGTGSVTKKDKRQKKNK
jgi:hypothetical protein